MVNSCGDLFYKSNFANQSTVIIHSSFVFSLSFFRQNTVFQNCTGLAENYADIQFLRSFLTNLSREPVSYIHHTVSSFVSILSWDSPKLLVDFFFNLYTLSFNFYIAKSYEFSKYIMYPPLQCQTDQFHCPQTPCTSLVKHCPLTYPKEIGIHLPVFHPYQFFGFF